MTRHRMGLDSDGVFHVQTEFRARPDLSYTWNTSFVLYRDHADGKLGWGVWDGHRILVSTTDVDAALRLVTALVEKGYFFADTILPDATPDETGEAFLVVLPSEFSERVTIPTGDLDTLRAHRSALEAGA